MGAQVSVRHKDQHLVCMVDAMVRAGGVSNAIAIERVDSLIVVAITRCGRALLFDELVEQGQGVCKRLSTARLA